MFRLRLAPTLLLATLLVGLAVPAAAQGTHVSATSMNSKRALHTMTTMPSGKVIAIGGTDPFLSYESLVTAEVFDPVTNTWTLTGNLHQGREEHAATALADGRVLVTGGQNPTSVAWHPSSFVLNSAEVFDPASNAFINVGPMNDYRLGHQATRLADGRVLLTGGHNNPGIIYGAYGANAPQTTASAEFFNPATNSFTPVSSSMTIPRAYHTATLLADGRVLIVGGLGTAATSAEVFDPATSTFTPIAAATTASRRTHSAVRLDDGRVLIAGGQGSSGTAEYFDPAAATFTALPPLASSYGFWGVMEKMTDGGIYLQNNGVAQLFKPALNTFTLVGPSGAGRSFSAGAALADRRVLVSGGQDFVPYTFVSRDYARVFVPNDVPVANAGADQSVSPGANCTAAVTLDGSQSSDPDGNALTFEWTSGGVVVGSSASVNLTLAPGTHTFTLTVSDGQGGTATDEVSIVVADTMPPSFAAPLPMPVTLEQAGPAGTFFAIAIPAATDNCDASPIVSVSGVPAGSIFPAGSTDVTFTASDASGNTASMTIAVTVRDTIAPVLNVPASISVDATSAAGAPVSFTASATDAVTAAPVVTCAPASGSVFPIGTTTVQCSTIDAAGNGSNGSFDVTVTDTIGPDITTVSPNPAQLWPPNHRMVPVTITAIATDNASATECRIDSVSSNQPSDDDWAITGLLALDLRAERLGSAARVYTINVRCTDRAGNSTLGATTVTVPHDQRR